MLGALSPLAAFVPVHPLAAYGPPTAETPAVKPDWYLLWIFGFLKLIPAGVGFSVGPITINPEFLGGVLFPGSFFGVMTLVPWLDRTNRHVLRRFEYWSRRRKHRYGSRSALARSRSLGCCCSPRTTTRSG